MSSILTVLMLVILFATVAVLYADGLWSNAVRLINVVTTGLLAVNFFEPLACWLDDWQPSFSYVWDFIALWALFALFMTITTLLTNQVSKVKVRFMKVVDQVGGIVFALWIGWIMVCFTMTTLHTAPLARNFMFDGFQPEQHMLMGFAPDRQWLSFMQKESLGAFAHPATPEQWEQETYVFDPSAEFMPHYAARRTKLQENVTENNSIRVKQ